MKRELQIILLFSVILCLFSLKLMIETPKATVNKHLFSGVTTWQPPVIGKASSDSNDLISANPFSSRFFENSKLRGFIRNSKNDWCAIFDSPGFSAQILEPGVSKAGLTLISANGRYCRVKFGSIIREFRL